MDGEGHIRHQESICSINAVYLGCVKGKLDKWYNEKGKKFIFVCLLPRCGHMLLTPAPLLTIAKDIQRENALPESERMDAIEFAFHACFLRTKKAVPSMRHNSNNNNKKIRINS